jgi:hypothetical protein
VISFLVKNLEGSFYGGAVKHPKVPSHHTTQYERAPVKWDSQQQDKTAEKQVAKGGGEVNAGERRLGTGALELRRGREQERLAKDARVACALGTAFFTSLSLVLPPHEILFL